VSAVGGRVRARGCQTRPGRRESPMTGKTTKAKPPAFAEGFAVEAPGIEFVVAQRRNPLRNAILADISLE
jgi:hypothetical protein